MEIQHLLVFNFILKTFSQVDKDYEYNDNKLLYGWEVIILANPRKFPQQPYSQNCVFFYIYKFHEFAITISSLRRNELIFHK